MIPLRDLNHAQTRPIATYALLAVNLVVFAYQLTLDPSAERRFIFAFGFVPAAITLGGDASAWLSAVTSMFMHGGIMHFVGNMWFLHIFGDNVEDAFGSRRFVVFYIACGLLAAAAQYAIDPSSAVPMVGASGAIAGVLGAYFRLFPRARILTLIPIVVVMFVREVPAVFFLILWFGMQLLSGVGSLGASMQGGGVAFFAHIGGFVAGIVLVAILGRRRGHVAHGSRGSRPPPERKGSSWGIGRARGRDRRSGWDD